MSVHVRVAARTVLLLLPHPSPSAGLLRPNPARNRLLDATQICCGRTSNQAFLAGLLSVQLSPTGVPVLLVCCGKLLQKKNQVETLLIQFPALLTCFIPKILIDRWKIHNNALTFLKSDKILINNNNSLAAE